MGNAFNNKTLKMIDKNGAKGIAQSNQCSMWLDEFYKNTPMNNLRLIKK